MLNRFVFNKGTTRIGTFMLLIAWILFMAILTYIFSKWLSYSMNPNMNVDTTISRSGERVIILKVNRYNHYVVSGKINKADVSFLIDTGATSVSVPGHIAKKIGLKRGNPIRVLTASGEANAYSTNIDSLFIGDIELLDVRATIVPADNSDNVLLGMSALKRFSFTQEDGILTLKLTGK